MTGTDLIQEGNALISNVPGPPMPLYMAGARMTHYFPVSIPYHGSALNITVHSYAGLLEFGLTACRRVVSQEESWEIVKHLQDALKAIEALPPVVAPPAAADASPAADAPPVAEIVVPSSTGSSKSSARSEP